MPLIELEAHQFRCIAAARLSLHRQNNVIYGPNGAGKTTVLEAIHLLSRGRSFRVRNNRRLIQHGKEEFWLRGMVVDQAESIGEETATEGELPVPRKGQIGARYQRGVLDLRVNGEPGKKASELAQLLPVHVIDPATHGLIEGQPSERRRYIDWGVFHVEPAYLGHWRNYRRLLAQRNAALKSGASGELLEAWTQPLLAAGGAVHDARLRYTTVLGRHFSAVATRLVGVPVTLEYRSGGFDEIAYPLALAQNSVRDQQRGVTHIGPHRADLDIRLHRTRASESASRGQQKMLAAALVIAQIHCLADIGASRGTVLLDDPAAELDGDSLGRLMAEISELRVQTVVTAISPQDLAADSEAHVFHVKQGTIEQA